MQNQSFRTIISQPQNIIALGVTVISACALIVSIFQTRIMVEQRQLMHEQAKAAVWPRISLARGKSHSQEDYSITDYHLVLGNDGVGPAIIKGVRVTYKDQPVEHWWEMFQLFPGTDSIETFISNASISNTIVKIGEERQVLGLKYNLPLAQIYYREAEKINIEIIYESIYGDRWKFTHSSKGTETISVDQNVNFPEEEQFIY